MFLTAYVFKFPSFLNFKKYPSMAWGFVLWVAWWITFIIVYSNGMLPAATVSNHPFILAVLDVGDLTLLGFAICYCSGDVQFSWKRLAPLPIVFLFFIAYYFTLSKIFKSPPNATFTIWLFAPSAVLANVSILSLGWAFLVRWGMKAIPLFIVAAIYALAQLPAYLAAFLTMPKEYKEYANLLVGSEKIFAILAIGKLILAAYPLILFLSPEGYRPDMAQPKYWPSTEPIPLHPYISRSLIWGLSILVAAFLGALGNALFIGISWK
jgi:hypothetical protein